MIDLFEGELNYLLIFWLQNGKGGGKLVCRDSGMMLKGVFPDNIEK